MTDQLAPTRVAAGQPPSVRDGLGEQLAWLRRMRAEHPVHRDEFGHYHVFGYDDVQRVTKDPGVFSSNPARVLPEGVPNMTEGMMLVADPPKHSKLRRLAAQAFTPKKMRDLAPRVTQIANDLIDRAPGDEFDFVEHFSLLLPATVISELFGIPAEDVELFRRVVEQIMAIDPPNLTDEAAVRGSAETALGGPFMELMGYLLQLCAVRRIDPRPGLISDLLQAELDGQRLTDQEVASLAVQILQAGHLTTSAVLSHSILLLDEHPEAAAELRANRALIPAAVEEVLRCRPPSTRLQRYTTGDTEVAGHPIPANSVVVPWMLAANHDERVFPEPDRFDIHRNPNKHLSFGHGIHFCLGAMLARVEVVGALNTLFDRFTQLRVAPDQTVQFQETHLLFAPERVAIQVSRA
ncbi:cytochrome P450 [Goodfellowiella coeruleoviolacea]|uniref:Cytochrome P450 n=1 Tax=Goodfellowiella coeruleoviolacea TaxID=334858 RepID=A0AAE3GMB0_9PSEU|nr:cytochrome P450 [Goodfellowiella coeruleoviolacea]MCP2170190.1 Cytochrome P450 [Goodfellowiella coeruleoviolacea]